MLRQLFSLALKLLGGAALAVMIMLLVSAQYFPLSSQSFDTQIGQAVFNAKCSSCHVAEPDGENKMGPNLSKIGFEAQTRKPELNAAEFILESIFDPDAYREPGVEGHMPKGTLDDVSPKNVKDLIYYLASRGGKANYSDIAALKINAPKISSVQQKIEPIPIIQRGWELFHKELGCEACHSVFHNPGDDFLAPSLISAHQLPREYIIESLRDPSKTISPGYQQIYVKYKTGDTLAGRLIKQNEDSLELLHFDKFGHHTRSHIEKSELHTWNIAEHSIMPPYKLSPADEYALIAFFKFLQAGI